MYLLIDDTRDLNCDAIARNSKAAKELLKCNCWKCVCFDHDLGEEETGYGILKWMLDMKIYPEKIQLVTSNPVGRDNMGALLKQYFYFSIDNCNFTKEN
jgi:hypothetical protein